MLNNGYTCILNTLTAKFLFHPLFLKYLNPTDLVMKKKRCFNQDDFPASEIMHTILLLYFQNGTLALRVVNKYNLHVSDTNIHRISILSRFKLSISSFAVMVIFYASNVLNVL